MGEPAAGEVLAGRYRVVRPLRAGGMGAVYEVIDLATNRRRALKRMLPSLSDDPDLAARFRQEATVAGRVESEHVVEVFDAGVDEATRSPYLVMELLRGEDLGALSKRRGPLPAAEVVMLLGQVALGLDRTHAEEIVHRDLKLDNLFLTERDDGSPRVKILDFGIAKVLAGASGSMLSTRGLGTPLYMAPEQLRGDGTLDARADLYALGHIAFTLLVGAPYFADELRSSANVYAFVRKVERGATEPACRRAARAGVELPEAFDPWFGRAVAVDQEGRYGNASEQVAALADALDVAAPARPPRREPIVVAPSSAASSCSITPSEAAEMPTERAEAPIAVEASRSTTALVAAAAEATVAPAGRSRAAGAVLLVGAAIVFGAVLLRGAREPAPAAGEATASAAVEASERVEPVATVAEAPSSGEVGATAAATTSAAVATAPVASAAAPRLPPTRDGRARPPSATPSRREAAAAPSSSSASRPAPAPRATSSGAAMAPTPKYDPLGEL